LYIIYISGRHNIPVETWSSSKIFCAADAGGLLFDKCQTTTTNVNGLNSNTLGKHGTTPLGDLVTIIVTYDKTQNYTSNALGKYFASVGGHERLNHLIHSWMKRNTSQSLGGSYGEPSTT